MWYSCARIHQTIASKISFEFDVIYSELLCETELYLLPQFIVQIKVTTKCKPSLERYFKNKVTVEINEILLFTNKWIIIIICYLHFMNLRLLYLYRNQNQNIGDGNDSKFVFEFSESRDIWAEKKSTVTSQISAIHMMRLAPIQASQNETECHFISRCASRRRSTGSGGSGGGDEAPSNCAITRCARTTRQSQLLLTDIRLMIVCAARAECNFNRAGARDCGVYVTAAFVLSSPTEVWWMYRFGVGISGKTPPGGGPCGGRRSCEVS